jgi:hypothetical protein
VAGSRPGRRYITHHIYLYMYVTYIVAVSNID